MRRKDSQPASFILKLGVEAASHYYPPILRRPALLSYPGKFIPGRSSIGRLL